MFSLVPNLKVVAEGQVAPAAGLLMAIRSDPWKPPLNEFTPKMMNQKLSPSFG